MKLTDIPERSGQVPGRGPAVGRELEFFALGQRLTGVLTLPRARAPVPAVVLCTGWDPPSAAVSVFTNAGLATFTYSPSRAHWPNDLIVVLRAAVARVYGEDGVDGDRIAVLGLGPIAGGVALAAAADDPWIRALSVHDPVLDGSDWLRQLSGREKPDWARLVTDVRARLCARTAGNPGEDIALVPRTKRAGSTAQIDLATFDHLLRFRPGAHVARIEPSRLRMTRSAGPDGPSEREVIEQTCGWFLDNLSSSQYTVNVEHL